MTSATQHDDSEARQRPADDGSQLGHDIVTDHFSFHAIDQEIVPASNC